MIEKNCGLKNKFLRSFATAALFLSSFSGREAYAAEGVQVDFDVSCQRISSSEFIPVLSVKKITGIDERAEMVAWVLTGRESTNISIYSYDRAVRSLTLIDGGDYILEIKRVTRVDHIQRWIELGDLLLSTEFKAPFCDLRGVVNA